VKLPVNINTSMSIRRSDGTTEHKEWHGSIEELPGKMEELGRELTKINAELSVALKDLRKVPPPGKVKLKDLSPDLAKFENNSKVNFLLNAVDAKTKDPIPFEYVKIGVPDYDEFFQSAQEFYALLYECTEVVAQMRQLAAKILDSSAVDVRTELWMQVDNVRKKLLGGAQVDGELVSRFNLLVDLGGVLVKLTPVVGEKALKLAQRGEALILNAKTDIMNPKVLVHLDLIKDGIVASAKAMKDSGMVLVNFGKTLVHLDEKTGEKPRKAADPQVDEKSPAPVDADPASPPADP
jgi:hypothetical protein